MSKNCRDNWDLVHGEFQQIGASSLDFINEKLLQITIKCPGKREVIVELFFHFCSPDSLNRLHLIKKNPHETEQLWPNNKYTVHIWANSKNTDVIK